MSEANIVDTTARGTCWSVVINNPEPQDQWEVENLPAGWEIFGQPEVGKNGTPHLQLCLKTPQVRWSAVKNHFKRANISLARNPKALTKYVQKEETRAGEQIVVKSNIPTLFQYQDIIAEKWVQDEYNRRWQTAIEQTQLPMPDDVAMQYIDDLVAADIESGRRGAEFIAINPMWRSSWKRFWRSIIKRHATHPPSSSPGSSCSPDGSQSSCSDGSCSSDAS